MIDEILPAAVEVEESFTDAEKAMLFPEEEAVIANSVLKRRTEFATVRHCARTAMRRLGVLAAPILPGQRGAPQWPDGIVGSMTHCAGYRAAALATERDVTAIGIDAEPHEALPDGVAEAISLASERGMLAHLSAERPDICWDRLLFSAKESVYKAWFPLTQRWLDFSEADIAIDTAGRFVARLLVPGPVVGGRTLQEFDGRYLVRNGLAVTAIIVPR